jgi:CMP/dCMP kinase
MKLKKYHKLVVAADGSAASGKTTGAKLISKKYGLKFLSSGLLYRYASYLLLKNNPKNKHIYLKKKFNILNLKKLDNINLHTPKISEFTSLIAKEKKIRNILKTFQTNFARKYKKVCIEGRDIGTVILPKADVKFFFTCSLDIASKRRFNELKKIDAKIKLKDIKKSLKIRNFRDKSRKNSPLLKSSDGIIVNTGKLRNITGMVNKMSEILERKIKSKYGS